MLKKLFLQKQPEGRRTDMKVVVMSATLEVEKLSEFFGHCSVLNIPGRSFPVKEIFCNLLSPRDVGSSAYVTEVWLGLVSLWFWGDFFWGGEVTRMSCCVVFSASLQEIREESLV